MKNYKKYSALCILLISISCSNGSDDSVTSYQYQTPDEINLFLSEIESNYPLIARVETVGTSESGRSIKALIISDNPGTLEGEPAVRLTGGIHGSEMMSIELLTRFIEYLTSNYSANPTVKTLVDNRYICIIPVLNPDGLASNSRYNSRGVDINRNFNDTGNHWAAGFDHGTAAFSESETRALRDYSLTKNFNLSITYHIGSVLVNMLFDFATEATQVPQQYTLVKSYAKTYTKTGSFLSNPELYISPYMDEGTINGGNWYVITGSLQDWSFTQTQCLDLTIEVARRNPSFEEGVQQIFMYNRDSLMAYIDRAGSDTFTGF